LLFQDGSNTRNDGAFQPPILTADFFSASWILGEIVIRYSRLQSSKGL